MEVIRQFDEYNNINVTNFEQYFYNHAIYSCLNELLDQFRPYG